jgi:hypothetical protein
MPFIIRLLLVLGAGVLGWSLFKDKKEPSKESNCQDEFLRYNSQLNITKTKENGLMQARRGIQKTLKAHLAKKDGYSIPKFWTQGSFTTGTMIRNEKDWCDLDLGIYFFEDPGYSYDTIQGHIKEALNNQTKMEVKLLSKCVRVLYSGGFHIDMPIYIVEDKDTFLLGSKGNVWEKCDSKKFKDWVDKLVASNDQIIRIVRYFKAWADNYKSKKGRKMPSGLVFTIWAIENFESDDRDDIAFVKTATNMLEELKSSWSCEMPVEPFDNVLERLNGDQQDNFKDALKELIKKGYEALIQDDKTQSLKIWKSMLGRRFSDIF